MKFVDFSVYEYEQLTKPDVLFSVCFILALWWSLWIQIISQINLRSFNHIPSELLHLSIFLIQRLSRGVTRANFFILVFYSFLSKNI